MLDGVGLVIFDEFYECSLDVDLVLVLIFNGCELLCDELLLKVLVMLVILEGECFVVLFGEVLVVCSEGCMFLVDICWGWLV